MTVHFSKYQGAGNDFVIIDNRKDHIQLTQRQIEWLCDRRFGIGADGLMLLEQDANTDFKMIYYNADGRESTMCGNGGRCIVKFAADLNLIQDKTRFIAIDGLHTAHVLTTTEIALGMIDVADIQVEDNTTILNTGSPHIIIPVDDLENLDVNTHGRAVRNDPRFSPNGINVNFIQKINGEWHIRTYERGVEAETLACGTGVTAAALSLSTNPGEYKITIKARGGDLTVQYLKATDHTFTHIILTGPATKVFDGTITLP